MHSMYSVLVTSAALAVGCCRLERFAMVAARRQGCALICNIGAHNMQETIPDDLENLGG